MFFCANEGLFDVMLLRFCIVEENAFWIRWTVAYSIGIIKEFFAGNYEGKRIDPAVLPAF